MIKPSRQNKVDINGGNIDGTAIGENSTSSGKFTTLETSDALTVNGALTAKGGLTVANGQTFSSNKVDINGGNIDGTAIGENSTSTGKFTTLETSGTLTAKGALTVANDKTFSSNNVNIDGGNIDGTAIGLTDASSGKFTTLDVTEKIVTNDIEINGNISDDNGNEITVDSLLRQLRQTGGGSGINNDDLILPVKSWFYDKFGLITRKNTDLNTESILLDENVDLSTDDTNWDSWFTTDDPNYNIKLDGRIKYKIEIYPSEISFDGGGLFIGFGNGIFPNIFNENELQKKKKNNILVYLTLYL